MSPIPNDFPATEQDLLEAILIALGGDMTMVQDIYPSRTLDLLYAIWQIISGGGIGTDVLVSGIGSLTAGTHDIPFTTDLTDANYIVWFYAWDTVFGDVAWKIENTDRYTDHFTVSVMNDCKYQFQCVKIKNS